MSKDVFARRSVNYFDPAKELGQELLREILSLASTAPSAFNLQPWEVLALQSKEAKARLYELAMKQDKIQDAPVVLLILGDRDAYSEANPVWGELAKVMGEGVAGAKQAAAHLYGSSEERKIKFAESNAGLLAMSILYAAKSLGVDSHPMSGIDFAGVKKEFAIAGGKEVVMAIALGYFDESKELPPRGYRKPYDELVTRL